MEAKYAIPRSPGLVHAHRTQKLVRPRLKLHAVWSFAHALRICVLDETTFHGSSMVIQALAMTIEDSMRIAASRGAKPDTIVVVGDNTVKELQNSYCLNYLLSLTFHKRVRYPRCSFIFSMVGSLPCTPASKHFFRMMTLKVLMRYDDACCPHT